MPYINCPDGNTYSTYSTDPTAIRCIEARNRMREAEAIACQQDPECSFQKKRDAALGFTGIIIMLTLLLVLIYKLLCELNDNETF